MALTVKGIERNLSPGLHHDSEGLYLRVSATGGKSWVYRFRWAGKPREMGLGSLRETGLAEARSKRNEERKILDPHPDSGRIPQNPIEARKAKKRNQIEEDAKSKTFGFCAVEFFEGKARFEGKASPAWSERFLKQRKAMVERHAKRLESIPMREIDAKLIKEILIPIWTEKTTTAVELRIMLESIFDLGIHRGYCPKYNPCKWDGVLQYELPKPTKSEKHHAALPYREIPAFMARLQAQGGVAARAVEFVILTGVRSSEVRGASWQEIDFERSLWSIPPRRMKSGKEHIVPLSPRAVEILEQRRQEVAAVLGPTPAGLIFSSRIGGPALSDMSLTAVLRRMKCEVVEHGETRKVTVHGFRSCLRDWIGDSTDFPREIAEAVLAHSLGKVEGAYRRGSALEKRRRLMDLWAAYCLSGSS